MPREQFQYDGSRHLRDLLDEAGQRAGLSRGQTFDDFLACTICALANQHMEDEYLVAPRPLAILELLEEALRERAATSSGHV